MLEKIPEGLQKISTKCGVSLELKVSIVAAPPFSPTEGAESSVSARYSITCSSSNAEIMFNGGAFGGSGTKYFRSLSEVALWCEDYAKSHGF